MQIILSIDGLSHQDFHEQHMPHLYRLAQKHRFYPTLQTIFPSVTWAVHTSVVTGHLPNEHGVYANSFFSDEKQERFYWDMYCQKEMVMQQPAFYDRLQAEGKTIASICWPLTQGASSIAYNIPEFYTQKEFDQGCTPDFYQELLDHQIPVNRYGAWSNTPLLGTLQDDLTQQIMEYTILKKKPDVVMGHFLLIDTMEHEFGCHTPETHFAMAYVDGLIGRMMAFLQDNHLCDETQLIIFSDHGHENFSQVWHLDEALAQHGLAETVQYADNGGALLFYVEHIEDQEALEGFLTNCPYVEQMIANRQPKHSQPNYLVALKSGITTDGYRNGRMVGSTHGYDPETCPRMNGIAICASVQELPTVVDNGCVTDIYQWICPSNHL